MIMVDGIWYNENSDSDLCEIARNFDYDFGNCLERRFSFYENEIENMKEDRDEY